MHRPTPPLLPPKKTHPVEILRLSLFMSLGCLLLKCLPRRGPPASTMDTQATSRKCPASSPLNAEAHQPTASIGSISLPRVLCSAMLRALRLAPTVLGTPTPAMRSCFTQIDYVGEALGGCNRKRKCPIPRIDPPALCTKAKVAKGGRICGTLQYLCVTFFTQHLKC